MNNFLCSLLMVAAIGGASPKTTIDPLKSTWEAEPTLVMLPIGEVKQPFLVIGTTEVGGVHYEVLYTVIEGAPVLAIIRATGVDDDGDVAFTKVTIEDEPEKVRALLAKLAWKK